MIFTRLDINGVVYTDAEHIDIDKSVGEQNSSSFCSVTFQNIQGKYSSTIVVGNTLKVWAEEDTVPDGTGTPLFSGKVENVSFTGNGSNRESMIISGRDNTSYLLDATVEPNVYQNQEVSAIVTAIMSAYVPELTTTNVQVTTTVIDTIRFNHTPVFDALKQLADYVDYYFYVDTDSDLHFEPKNTVSSGVTLESGVNILSSRVKTVRDQLYNKIWVYGDRVLTKFQDSFTANGGSVYTLSYRPHNTEVLVGGSTASKIGGIFQVLAAGDVGSPTQYLVDYEAKRIIFVSGTNTGNNIPVSGTDSIVVNADRLKPIIKYGQDDASITAYGAVTHVENDTNITTAAQAKVRLQTLLQRHSSPLSNGSIRVRGFFQVQPGNTVVVNIPYEDISNEVYEILRAKYSFTQRTCLSGDVLTVEVNRKLLDASETMKRILLDLRKLQAQDLSETDVISRLQYATGSVGARVKSWKTYTRDIGSSFILGHPTHGVLGLQSGDNEYISGGYLYYDVNGYIQWGSFQPYLGDSRGPLTLYQSGGEL